MKKTFVNPTLKRFAYNTNEKIVASISFDDGEVNSSWYFVQSKNEAGEPVDSTEWNVGCYDLLVSYFNPFPQLKKEYEWHTWIGQISNPDYEYYNQYTACRHSSWE